MPKLVYITIKKDGVQTRRIYKSEGTVRHLFSVFDTIGEIRNFVDEVVESKWVRRKILSKNYWHINLVEVEDLGMRKVWPYAQWLTIYIPSFYTEARSQMTILHELAHIFLQHKHSNNYGDGHGPEFVEYYLPLVRYFAGKKVYNALIRAFNDHKVNCGLA